MLRFAWTYSRRDPAAVELVIPRVAGQVKELKEQRATVAREVEGTLEDFPLASVLMSVPGIGPVTRRSGTYYQPLTTEPTAPAA